MIRFPLQVLLACGKNNDEEIGSTWRRTMRDGKKETKFPVIAKLCEDGARGCPTVLEGEQGDALIVVGKLDATVLNSEDVQKHTGEGEIAVVIPKRLLIEAAKALV
jgi:hypothetical protein